MLEKPSVKNTGLVQRLRQLIKNFIAVWRTSERQLHSNLDWPFDKGDREFVSSNKVVIRYQLPGAPGHFSPTKPSCKIVGVFASFLMEIKNVLGEK